MRSVANWNGQISPAEDTKVPIFDRGFLYGDSIYEVVRTYKGVPFMHKEHLDRLENSARLARMKLSQSRDFLTTEIKRTIAAGKPDQDVFVRYTITRGTGPLNLNPYSVEKTSYLILTGPVSKWNEEFYSRGTRLFLAKTRRNSPLALDPNIKSGNYLNSVLAAGEAADAGCDDAVMVSIDNKITEATNSNICFVFDGEVHSPMDEPGTNTGNLHGITKRVVEFLCEDLGFKYKERPILPEEISRADEAFQCSATREVMPVYSMQMAPGKTKQFPAGGGALTRSLQEAYQAYLKNYVVQYKNEAWF